MKPTLFVLAAGMGSRYGGLKQLDGLGPNGETIMDYSIFDAIRGGFGKLVFVIRRVLMGKDVIKEPFAVINADDFYGRDSFAVLGKYLSELPEGSKNDYCMVGFRVGNTLSESGTVARGVCSTDDKDCLATVVERTEIMRVNGAVSYKDENGEWVAIPDNTPVSMNMWGFTPDYFKYSEDFFVEYLKENIDKPKAEYFIPLMVNKLINEGTSTVKVLDTTSHWFGVTYAADRQGVVDKIQALVDAGEYPSKLF